MIKIFLNFILNKIGYEIRKIKNINITPVVENTIKTDRLILHETITGNYYLPQDAHQDIIANAIKENNIFDIDVFECAKEFITKDSTVLDIGANFGQMSVLFSNLVGKSGHVYSFEADDFIFKILQKNIEINQCENVIPIFGAVHNREGEKLIFPEQDFQRFGTYGSYGIDYTGQNTGREVNSLTIDSLNISEKISLIKVDIQGGDLLALEGAINTILKYRMPILFEFEYLFQDDLNIKFQDYVDFVHKINYYFDRVINGQNYLILPRS